jgi:hypothetical protein
VVSILISAMPKLLVSVLFSVLLMFVAKFKVSDLFSVQPKFCIFQCEVNPTPDSHVKHHMMQACCPKVAVKPI